MAITVKYLTELGIEKEVAEKIFAERGKEIADEKAKFDEQIARTAKASEQIDELTKELDTLKESKASAEDWESKYNQIKTDWDNEKAETKKAQLEAEKKANIDSRFAVAVGDKKFSHPAIEADYRAKFGVEVEKADGRGDIDILSALTKDDAQAFVGNTISVNLAGAKPIGNSVDDTQARAIMGLSSK